MPEKQYVTFYSPGTFVSETTSREIDSWDVEKACEMAHSVSERYGATPCAFQFTTRGRNESEFASRVIRTSPRYWLGGKVEALAEVEARATERDSILLANMRGNGWGPDHNEQQLVLVDGPIRGRQGCAAGLDATATEAGGPR